MTEHDRDRKGQFVQALGGAERDRKAVQMHSRRQTYQQISDELGYGHSSNARRAVKKILDGIIVEGRDEAIKIELDGLDMMTRAVIDVLEGQHYVVSDGRIVYLGDKDDPDRTELLDDGPVLQAVDRLLKISDRRAKLLGLDAPKRVEVSDTTPDLDAAVRDLAAELAAAGRGTEVPQE
jgi:hypothetical protein